MPPDVTPMLLRERETMHPVGHDAHIVPKRTTFAGVPAVTET